MKPVVPREFPPMPSNHQAANVKRSNCLRLYTLRSEISSAWLPLMSDLTLTLYKTRLTLNACQLAGRELCSSVPVRAQKCQYMCAGIGNLSKGYHGGV